MSDRTNTRNQFDAIVTGQRDLTEAAFKLQDVRERLIEVSKHVDAAERYDVHAPVAKAIDAVDTALSQLTAEVNGE